MKGFISALLLLVGAASVQASPVVHYHYNAVNQLVQADTGTGVYHYGYYTTGARAYKSDDQGHRIDFAYDS